METSPDRSRRSGGHARSGPLLRTRDADAAPPRHRAPDAVSREGTRARPVRARPGLLAAGAAATVAVLAGAAVVLLGGDDPGLRATAAVAQPTAPTVSPRVTSAPASELPPVVRAATGPDRTPASARAALQELLQQRAEGNLLLLRSTWEGDEAAAEQAAKRVVATSTGLSAVLSVWQDADLATGIRTGLDEQSAASRAYAAAVAADDTARADRARGSMGEVSRELGDLLAGTTDGRIADYVPPQDAAQYRAYVDALEAEDAAGAAAAAEWLRGRLSREGAALSAGVSEGGPS